jgi:hypothetical protein
MKKKKFKFQPHRKHSHTTAYSDRLMMFRKNNRFHTTNFKKNKYTVDEIQIILT